MALALALPAAAQEVTLRMHHFAPPQAPAHALLAGAWAAKLEKDSGGRMRIPVFPALGLGGSVASLEAQLREGEVDIVLTAPSFTPGRFPRTEIFELPFLGAGAPAGTFALQDYYDRHLQAEYRDYHVLLLFAHDGAALHLKRPVRRLEDLQGLKIRAQGRAGAAFLRAVGATSIGSPAAHLAPMLAKGLLDGALAPFAALAEHDLHELVRHHVAFEQRLGTSVYALLMNRGRYLALPASLRGLVDAHSRRHLAWYAGKTWAEIEAPGIAAARAAGNDISALPPAEAARIRAAVAAETERYLADASRHGGFDATALYNDARQLIEKYRKH
ncbi:MAG: TRAP transporter substrate-binding protein [Betaproteobacteria bacterium]